jgi:16S rRNA C967 or C1407 C5-methylase (RsmB/RsmF family)
MYFRTTDVAIATPLSYRFAMKKLKVSKNSDNDKFQQFFSKLYQDRWSDLHRSLLAPEKKIARSVMGKNQLPNTKEYPKNCYWFEENDRELRNAKGKYFHYYIMDPASVIAARYLPINGKDKVLDMCSAPGGKALILAEQLDLGELVVNDPSRNRRNRLKQVLKDYLPEEKRQNVQMQGKDGISIGMLQPTYFDKILVDAPCSGERHILSNPKELQKWSPKRSKRLATQQYGLLCSALLALKPGGQIVYSTCSISPLENDGVIERLINKKGNQFELDLDLIPLEDPNCEKTAFGYQYMPDRAGFGPIYFTRIKKLLN